MIAWMVLLWRLLLSWRSCVANAMNLFKMTVKIYIRKVDDFLLLKVSGINAPFSTCYISFVGQDDFKFEYSNTADQLRG